MFGTRPKSSYTVDLSFISLLLGRSFIYPLRLSMASFSCARNLLFLVVSLVPFLSYCIEVTWINGDTVVMNRTIPVSFIDNIGPVDIYLENALGFADSEIIASKSSARSAPKFWFADMLQACSLLVHICGRLPLSAPKVVPCPLGKVTTSPCMIRVI